MNFAYPYYLYAQIGSFNIHAREYMPTEETSTEEVLIDRNYLLNF